MDGWINGWIEMDGGGGDDGGCFSFPPLHILREVFRLRSSQPWIPQDGFGSPCNILESRTAI